eukprot:8332274-Pyramimonas_sp.AAC.1
MAKKNLIYLVPPPTGPRDTEMSNVDQIHKSMTTQLQKGADLQDAERKASHSKAPARSYLLHVTDQNSNVQDPSKDMPLLF